MMVVIVPVRAMEMALKALASGSSEARDAVPSPCALAPMDSPRVTGLVMDSLSIKAAPKFAPNRPGREEGRAEERVRGSMARRGKIARTAAGVSHAEVHAEGRSRVKKPTGHDHKGHGEAHISLEHVRTGDGQRGGQLP